jgi:hypothetical protein
VLHLMVVALGSRLFDFLFMVNCVFNVDDMSQSLSRDGEREFDDGEHRFASGCTH